MDVQAAGQILGIFNHDRISASEWYGEMDHGGRGVGIIYGFY
jgi:hypothetical protein